MFELLLEHLERLKRIPAKPIGLVVWIGAGVFAGLNIIVHGTKVVINHLDRHFDRADEHKKQLAFNKENLDLQVENLAKKLQLQLEYDIIRQKRGLSPVQEGIPVQDVQESILVSSVSPVSPVSPLPAVPVPPVDEHPFTLMQFLRLHLRPRPANHPIHYDSDHNELLNVFEALR